MKKLLSLLLSVLMISTIAIMPVSAIEEEQTSCENHIVEKVITKATLKKDGSVTEVCKNCKEVISTFKISKVNNIYLSEDEYYYNGKTRKPKVIVLAEDGLVLSKNKDYSVTYKTNRKDCGKHKVLVTLKGNNYKGKKTLKFTIKSNETFLDESVVKSNTSVALKWLPATKVTGYQVQCSTTSNFKKGTIKIVNVTGSTKTSVTVSNLKKNVSYYFRVRGYNKAGKKSVYSSWSNVKNVSLSKYGYSVKDLINKEKINPIKTNYKKLDKLVNKLLKKITKPSMTTYEKVQACYNYLVNNIKYGQSFSDIDVSSYVSGYDAMLVDYAYTVLTKKIGVCNHYSAAFVVMCRKLGLNANVSSGTVSKVGGGRTGHMWAYIELNGTQYIFDPQVQSNNKHVPYYFFGKTYSQTGSTYENRSGSNAMYFCNFEKMKNSQTKEPPMNMESKISLTGKNTTLNEELKQDGYSSHTLSLNEYAEPVEAFENGTLEMNVDVSGGSGKYIVTIEYKDKIQYIKETKSNVKFQLDLSKFKEDELFLSVVIYNANTNEPTLKLNKLKVKK